MVLKPQPELIKKKYHNISALFVFLFSLVVYISTLPRTLQFWDSGEYIACSSILGVPHPPGNPLYILLGRVFSIFSFDYSHAAAVNFLSAVFGVFAVLFTYYITVKLVTMWEYRKGQSYFPYLAGICAALFTAFSNTFWINSLKGEVYSGLAFIINLSILITFIWVEKSRKFSHQNYLVLVLYLLFLGIGIHQTSLQIAPALLFIVVYPYIKENIKTGGFWVKVGIYMIILIIVYLIFQEFGKVWDLPELPKYMFAIGLSLIVYFYMKDKVAPSAWWLAILFITIGFSTHLFLYIRSGLRPFINEGHPHTLRMFTDYILRRQYGPTSFFIRRASLVYQFRDQLLTYFSWQFFNAEILSQWLRIPQAVMQVLSNLLVTILGFSGVIYHYKRNKHSFFYLLALFIMASFAMVFVMNLSDAEVRTREYFFVTAYNMWAIWMGIGVIGLIHLVKKKWRYLQIPVIIILLSLPIINLASNYQINNRSRDFIPAGYGQNILNSLEENAIIFTYGDNDTFPSWYAQAVWDPVITEHIHPARNVQPTERTERLIAEALEYKEDQCEGIRLDVSVANLSLLNTPWYIKQLRDLEGIKFDLPDEHIELCQESPRSALYPRRVPQDTSLRIRGNTPEEDFTVTFPAGSILMTKDLATIQIIRDNYGKRPIYFAVTVPEVPGFAPYLQNEGMVDRLVPTSGRNQIDIERLVTNIDSIYNYIGVFDETVYKDLNTRRLLNNYGAAYFRASQYYHNLNDYEKAVDFMVRGIEFVDGKERFYPGLAQLLTEASYQAVDDDNIERSFEYIEQAIQYDPTETDIIYTIQSIASYTGEFEKGIALLESLKQYQDQRGVNQIDMIIRSLSRSLDE
jgi:hypothetical protein